MGLLVVPTREELERQQTRRDKAAAADARIARILLRWEKILNGMMTSNKSFELGQGTRQRLGLEPNKTSGELERQNKRKERASADDSPTTKKAKTVELIELEEDINSDDDEEEEEEEEEEANKRGGGVESDEEEDED